jgi:hypothetical protein
MFCSNCGKENSDDARFCASCGNPITDTPPQQYTPPPPQYAPPQPQYAPPQYTSPQQQTAQPAAAKHTSGLAVTSLVFGIIGGVLFAIIFGAIALGQIRKNPNLSGRGLAVAGLILGILWMVILVIIIMVNVPRASL